MINTNEYRQGTGMKLVLVITADDPNSLGEALQSAIDDIGMARMQNAEATDEYFYKFEIYDQHRPELLEPV